MQSAPEHSLLDTLKSAAGFESATFSTFSIDLPFFEDVVVPRLRAAGCRHINLLVDDRQLRFQMKEASTAARLAGRFYTLIPIHSDAAFHPKIVLLVGKKKGLLHVGSHNVTISGLSHNRELTAFVSVTPSDSDAIAIANSIWASIWNWASQCKRDLPKSALDALAATRAFAPWLGSSVQHNARAFGVFSQTRSSASLWSQVQSSLPEKAIRVSVLGAFFDAKLSFLRVLRDKYPKASIAVGIDPRSVQLPTAGASASSYSWRDLSQFYSDHYLHAKALYIEGKDAAALFVGSANPSAPAWIGAEGEIKNDECVSLSRGAEAKKAAKLLQLDLINSFPEISQSLLTEIAARSRTELANEQKEAALAPEVIVCGLESNALLFVPGVKAKALHAIEGVADEGSPCWSRTGGWVEDEDGLTIQLSSDEADVTRLKLSFRGGRLANGLIHRALEIGTLSRTGKEKALRDALDGLRGQGTDVASLIALVEKAIFEDPADTGRQQRSRTSAPNTNLSSIKPRPELLVVDLEDIKRKRAYGRLLGSGDSSLSALISALLHAMRVPGSSNALVDAQGRTEEEFSGQDDEEGVPPGSKPRVDDKDIAQLCRSRVRSLVRRTAEYLERASQSGSPYDWRDGLLKITAVLAVLRELKSVELIERWVSAREVFVTQKDFLNLLDGIVGPLFDKKEGLIRRLVHHMGYDRFDELARLKGLLIWAAWECKANPLAPISTMDDADEMWTKLFDRAVFVAISQVLPRDKMAIDEVSRSLDLATRLTYRMRAASWYEGISGWMRGIEGALSSPKAQKESVVGGLAFISSDPQRELRVVAQTSGEFVSVVELGAENRRATYQRGKVVAMLFQ
jgi:hypothetical protein